MTGLGRTAIRIIAGAVVFAWIPMVSAESRQLACTGSMIEPTGFAQSPKTAQLNINSSPEKVGVDLGNGMIDARVVSNNNIQLKFETKDFTGEFFHYTGDLFFIYPSGHLARLTCSPK